MQHQDIDPIGEVAKVRDALIAKIRVSLGAWYVPDPKLESSIEAATDFLLSHAASPASDDAIVLERASALEPVARSLVQEVLVLGLLVKKLAEFAQELPPSNGYQPLLRELGLQPIFARLAAHIITRHGNREAGDARAVGDVVRSIRFLAKSGQPARAARERIEFLLEKGRQTTVLEPILPGATDENNFIKLLEVAAAAGQTDELTARCAELVPHLKLKRGPRISAASFAHQFLLENLPPGNRAYTYDPNGDGYNDPMTKATRSEFGDPKFDPRPAHRRRKRARK